MATPQQNPAPDNRLEPGKDKNQEQIHIFHDILTAESNQMLFRYYYTLRHNAELEQKQALAKDTTQNQKKFQYYQLFLQSEFAKYLTLDKNKAELNNSFEKFKKLLDNERIEYEILKAPLIKKTPVDSQEIQSPISLNLVERVISHTPETSGGLEPVRNEKSASTTIAQTTLPDTIPNPEIHSTAELNIIPVGDLVLAEDEKVILQNMYDAKLPELNFITALERRTELENKPTALTVLALSGSRLAEAERFEGKGQKSLLDPLVLIPEKQASVTRGFLIAHQDEKNSSAIEIEKINSRIQNDPAAIFTLPPESKSLRFESLPQDFRFQVQTGIISAPEEKIIIGNIVQSISVTVGLQLENIRKSQILNKSFQKNNAAGALIDSDPARLQDTRQTFEQLDQSISNLPAFDDLPERIRELVTVTGNESGYRAARLSSIKQAILLNVRSEIPGRIITTGLPVLFAGLFPSKAANSIPRKLQKRGLFGKKDQVSVKEDRKIEEVPASAGQNENILPQRFEPVLPKIPEISQESQSTEAASNFSLNATNSTLKGAGIAVGAGIVGLAAATLAAHIVENAPETIQTSLAGIKSIGSFFMFIFG